MDADLSFKSLFHPHLLESDRYKFMTLPSRDNTADKVYQFIRRVNLQSKVNDCMVCSHEVQTSHTETFALTDIPNPSCLRPVNDHIDHELFGDALVNSSSVVWDRDGAFGSICRSCLRCLRRCSTPPNSLAAGNWIGPRPSPLIGLTLAERILVARQPSAAYIIHEKGVEFDLDDAIGLNDDSYRFTPPAVMQTLPMSLDHLLSFFKFASNACAFDALPPCLSIRRAKIEDVLVWLKLNNQFYSDIEISQVTLSALPHNGVPDILARHVMKDMRVGQQRTLRIVFNKMCAIGDDFDNSYIRNRTFTWMFPWLFARGTSILSACSTSPSTAATRFLSNADHQFRTDELFVSKLFGIAQADQAIRAVSIDNKSLSEFQSEYEIGHMRPETQRALCKCAAIVLATLPGSCVSRTNIERKLWSVTTLKNPPVFWFKVDPLDVLPGHELLTKSLNPNARDPFMVIRLLRNTVISMMEDLMAISTSGTLSPSTHGVGVIGKISAYLTSIEDNKKGSLRVHVAIWMSDSPTFPELNFKLWSATFRKDIAAYLERCFANLDNNSFLNGKNLPLEPLHPAPFKKHAKSSGLSWLPWNDALMSAANVHVEGRVITYAEDTAYLGRLMGSPVKLRHPIQPILTAISSLKTHPPTGEPTIAHIKSIVQHMVAHFSIDQDINQSQQLHYLMGWDDSMASHPFVEIDLNEMRCQLLNVYPSLCHCVRKSTVNEEILASCVPTSSAISLEEYKDRGWTLSDHNFLDFSLTTVNMNKQDPRYLKRLYYRGDSNRAGCARAPRSCDTLPFFSGEWFPRSDDPRSYDLHCAMIMSLLKPWRTMATLREEGLSWEISFELFHASADAKTQAIIQNIQFYYEAHDARCG